MIPIGRTGMRRRGRRGIARSGGRRSTGVFGKWMALSHVPAGDPTRHRITVHGHECVEDWWPQTYRAVCGAMGPMRLRDGRMARVMSVLRKAMAIGFLPRCGSDPWFNPLEIMQIAQRADRDPLADGCGPQSCLAAILFGGSDIAMASRIPIVDASETRDDDPILHTTDAVSNLRNPLVMTGDAAGNKVSYVEGDLTPFLGRGFDWTCDMLMGFLIEGGADLGRTIGTLHDDWMREGAFVCDILEVALSGMTAAPDDPEGFGRALAHVWMDAYNLCSGENPKGALSDIGLLRRWRHAIEWMPGLPECAMSMAAMRWLLRADDNVYIRADSDSFLAPCLVLGDDVISALEHADMRPDYGAVLDVSERAGGVPVPGHEREGWIIAHGDPLTLMMLASDSPAMMLGVLRFADAALAISGVDPRDSGGLAYPFRISAEKTEGYADAVPFLGPDMVSAIVDALEMGMPVDMISEMVAFRGRGRDADSDDDGRRGRGRMESALVGSVAAGGGWGMRR